MASGAPDASYTVGSFDVDEAVGIKSYKIKSRREDRGHETISIWCLSTAVASLLDAVLPFSIAT